MIRIWTVAVLSMLLVGLPLACSKKGGGSVRQQGGGPVILCSTFPMYLFTRNIVAGREGAQVDIMVPSAMGCPHDYTLTPQDLRKIAAADVFVANGLGMEEFLGDPIKRVNSKIETIDSSAGIDELIQIESHAHDEHNAQGGAREDHSHHGLNPHLFASPRMAAKVVRNIAAGLGKIDPAGAKLYADNAQSYAARLEELANEISAELKDVPNRKIVTQHAVLDYLARDCSLEIVAVIEENPGQEPSAAEMLRLVADIKASGAAAIFTEPQYSAKAGQTIANEAGIPVAVLDPVASGPNDAPPDYYEKTMRLNLVTLSETLKAKAK